MAANTIEPTTGASTWALGSHKWNGNIGNFTRKPIIRAREKIFELVAESALRLLAVKDEFIIFSTKIKKISRGKEAEIVYITIKRLAKIRSGWPPQPKINSIIGTRLSSKVIYKQIKEFLLKNAIKIRLSLKIIVNINLKGIWVVDLPIENVIKIEIKIVRVIRMEDMKSRPLVQLDTTMRLSEENSQVALLRSKKRHVPKRTSGPIRGKK